MRCNFNDYSGKIGEIPINRSRAQAIGAGENPLNRNGLPLVTGRRNSLLSYESMSVIKRCISSEYT